MTPHSEVRGLVASIIKDYQLALSVTDALMDPNPTAICMLINDLQEEILSVHEQGEDVYYKKVKLEDINEELTDKITELTDDNDTLKEEVSALRKDIEELELELMDYKKDNKWL